MTTTTTTTTTTPGSGIFIFIGVAAVVSLLAAASEAKKQESRTLHQRTGRVLSDEEQYVGTSIQVNMPPARRMGIAIEEVNLRRRRHSGQVDNDQGHNAGYDASSPYEAEGSVSLSMPIKGNTNIHGTAFAGSLYSLCVLSAWYTLVCHLRATLGDDIINKATVVVQSADIGYKRPLWNTKDNEFIVATSFLSSGDDAWKHFLSQLQDTGKTTCSISGEIRIKTGNKPSPAPEIAAPNAKEMETTKAVEFKALLCVLLPRSS